MSITMLARDQMMSAHERSRVASQSNATWRLLVSKWETFAHEHSLISTMFARDQTLLVHQQNHVGF